MTNTKKEIQHWWTKPYKGGIWAIWNVEEKYKGRWRTIKTHLSKKKAVEYATRYSEMINRKNVRIAMFERRDDLVYFVKDLEDDN